MSRNCHRSRLRWMMELPVAAASTCQLPTIFFDLFNNISNLQNLLFKNRLYCGLGVPVAAGVALGVATALGVAVGEGTATLGVAVGEGEASGVTAETGVGV